MTQTQREITWEKWRCPFGSDIRYEEWPGALGDFETDRINNPELDEDDEDYSDGFEMLEKESEHYDNANLIKNLEAARTKVLHTPLGIVPLTEHTSAGNIFNFWTAHCNFRITKSLFDIIDNTDGVETFQLNTPYRFKIAIGKAFDSQEVKLNVMNNLNATAPPPKKE